jgi:hypothetical protein
MAKIIFHMMLSTVPQYNLFVRPILAMIREQNGFAQQGGT